MNKQAFDKIKAGIEHAIALARGEAGLVSYRDHVAAGATPQRAFVDQIAALTRKVPQTDSTEMISEDRAR
jgi:hypothetical protein